MATNDKGLTPMMRQFFSMKEKHPEALLLFRCGDFYETYCDDAVEAARILGITLTRRNNGAASGAEMAGFPHHALDTYLPKLIRAGKRVAICDQLEDPKKKRAAIKGKKGLSEMDKMVKRGITELVTPGVAMGDNVLNYKENNFLAAIHFGKGACGVSLLDISTGEFLTGEGNYDYVEKLLGNFQPKEVLYDRTRKQDFEQQFGTKFVTFELDDWVFTDQTARQKLLKHFKTKNLKGFGVDHLRNGIVAAGAIMQYLELTQHTHISHITSLRRIEEDRYVRLDRFTIRSLELLQPMQEEGTSLLDVIDHTVTPMGGRMIRRWTVFPLRDVRQINERLDGGRRVSPHRRPGAHYLQGGGGPHLAPRGQPVAPCAGCHRAREDGLPGVGQRGHAARGRATEPLRDAPKENRAGDTARPTLADQQGGRDSGGLQS